MTSSGKPFEWGNMLDLNAEVARLNAEGWDTEIDAATRQKHAAILAAASAQWEHERMSAACTVYYPGSDGIPRSTSAELTRDHPHSSYGLPVIVVHDDPDDGPMDDFTAAFIDSFAGPGARLEAGSKAELLPAGVYGTHDLPAGSEIVVRYSQARIDIDTEETYDACVQRVDALIAAAKRAGYTIGTMFVRAT